MIYKGYHAKIEFSEDDGCFVGHILGIRDVVGFHGESVGELKAAFEDAVDGYLDVCERAGKEPNKPFSGRFVLRVDPELHAKAAIAAETAGKSLNQWAVETIRKAVA